MPEGIFHPLMADLATKDRDDRMPMMAPLRELPREEKDWEFYAEPIESWRAWNVVSFDDVLLLQSITYRVNWMPKQEMIAQCIRRPESDLKVHSHLAPDIEHGCGIYSVKHFGQALRWMNFGGSGDKKSSVRVMGKVFLWGHVFRFTEGFLSEYAYPSAIYVNTEHVEWFDAEPEEIRRELSATYGVEAEFL